MLSENVGGILGGILGEAHMYKVPSFVEARPKPKKIKIKFYKN